MTGPSRNPLRRLVGELHRRHVWQVLVVYLGTSYAILEATDLFIERIGLPARAVQCRDGGCQGGPQGRGWKTLTCPAR